MSREFGPYDILRELGRGAMGVVSLAVHRSLNRECALKTIALKFHDPRAAERFIHEGQAVARLGKHPNIVQVFDAGLVDNTPYIAMEFVAGDSLDRVASHRGPIPEAELLELGRKIALALDHAHRRGVIHRDVKPANIIIDQADEPQLLDFGIAKTLHGLAETSPPAAQVADAAKSLRESGATDEATFIATGGADLQEGIQGTPAFMAPEQADPRRGPVDARSDVYALGATLYVLATGRRPFEAGTLTDLLFRVVTHPPVSPAAFVDVSPDFEAIVMKSLEKDPAARYQTALEFADDLSRVTMGLPTRARKLGTIGWLGKRLRAHARIVAATAALCTIGVILAGYFLFRSRETQVLWRDIAERTARSTAQEVRSLLDPALPMLEECIALARSDLLPVDDQELLGRHLVARFRYQKKLSWLSYGDAYGRFTGAWRHPSGRIVIHRSWLDEQGGHVREQFADSAQERLRWSDEWTYDPRQRPFYQLACAATVPVWTQPYEWFDAEGLGITSAMALRDADSSKVRGVFTADYHLGALADFLADLRLGTQGRAYLLNRDGGLLASPRRGETAPDDLLREAVAQMPAMTSEGLQSLPIDAPRSFSFRHGVQDYVAAVEAFEPAAGLPVVTVVLVPEDDITGPVKATARRTAKIAGGVVVAVLGIVVLAGIVQKRRLKQALGQRRRFGRPPEAAAELDETSLAASGSS